MPKHRLIRLYTTGISLIEADPPQAHRLIRLYNPAHDKYFMEWVEVLFTYDEIEADIVQQVLEAEDIVVDVRSQRISPFPVNVCRMGEIRLMVKSGDLKRAHEVLQIMRETE